MSSRPANTSVYESTIHCSWLFVASRSRTIVGMATLRIVLSSTITSRLKQRTARIQPPPFVRPRVRRAWSVRWSWRWRPRDIETGSSRIRPAATASGDQPPAASTAARAASTAADDALTSGSRTSGVGIRPWAWSTPLNTAGLGSAKHGLHHREQRLGVGAAVVDLAREPALDHRDEALGAQVRRRADRAGAAHEHESGTGTVSSPPSTENVARRAGEDLERVGVERADAPASRPAMFGVLRELEHARGAEVAAGADRDVVDDDRHRARGGDRRGSARRCRPPTAARSTARRSSAAASAGVPASASTAAIVLAVLLVPAPTISCAPALGADTRRRRRSRRAARRRRARAPRRWCRARRCPAHPASSVARGARRSTASSATEPSAANGVIERDVHALRADGRSASRREGTASTSAPSPGERRRRASAR